MLAVETMGAWCVDGKELIKKIGRKLKLKTVDVKSTYYFIPKMCMVIQRGKDASMLSSIPTNEEL